MRRMVAYLREKFNRRTVRDVVKTDLEEFMNSWKVLAFTLVEKYTGMAIGDVTKLRLDELTKTHFW